MGHCSYLWEIAFCLRPKVDRTLAFGYKQCGLPCTIATAGLLVFLAGSGTCCSLLLYLVYSLCVCVI